ncbi:aminotransferase [Microbacterium sp. B2969]|uniref:Aminotransferase n=1 Tax=Microbacterium alkaliflavum TaxID=3248839 RepID=A0ABW7Q425_9MICO
MTDLAEPVETSLVQPAPPEISDDDARAIAEREWGVTGEVRSLGSHQDRNFLIDAGDRRLLLKIANPSVSAAELEAQSLAARAIGDGTPIRAPRAIAFDDGSTTREIEVAGVAMQARLLEFLDGETLSGSGYLSPAAVRAMGALAATVDNALAGLDPEGAERDHQWDLRHAPAVLEDLLPHVDDLDLRERLAGAAADAWAVVAPLADRLPTQFIHGDLTDDNVVHSADRLPDGVIDLGDLNRTWTAGELAITLSSLLHHDGVDLAAAMVAVNAYHSLRPLTTEEAEALWPLVVARGAVLVASAHHVLSTDAGNVYAAENLVHERVIFESAVSVPLPVASALVRAAIGHPVEQFAAPDGARAVETSSEIAVLDLSATSPSLDEGRWLDDDAESVLFAQALAHAGLAVAAFGESRLTRSRPGPDEPENVALGLELATREERSVHAPWAGVVVQSGGAVIVLRAGEVDLRVEGVTEAIAEGTEIEAGGIIGRVLGTAWVHMTRAGIAAPRFAPRSLAAAWRAVVADPTPFVTGIAEPAEKSADAASLLSRRDAVFADVQEHYFADPPVFVRGWREHLVDADGRVYLDTLNNVTSVGHAHPRLVAAVARQWSLLNTNSRFHYPAVVEFSERLAALLPESLDTVFLVNSGSEAVDLALRLAQAWTGRPDLLAVQEAYHGWTYLSDAVSTSVADNPAALETRPPFIHTVPAPNPFRGAHRGNKARRYADEAVAEVHRLAEEGTPVAGFIAEALFGNGGGIALPDGYLAAVYDAVRAYGGLAIADEVQVGYGRLGEWFWGFEQQGVVPDVVTVAKSMGSGHPLGAVVTTRAVAERYRTGGYFFSSAGGSPVSSVVGTTVLDILRDEDLQGNARDTGAYLKMRLQELAERHPLIGAVHGFGLYLGPEFVRDRETWEPATAETAAICDRLRDLGVVAQPTGDHQNILKIKPPMCFSRDSADALVAALDRVLTTGW